jgi:hypothetical protein
MEVEMDNEDLANFFDAKLLEFVEFHTKHMGEVYRQLGEVSGILASILSGLAALMPTLAELDPRFQDTFTRWAGSKTLPKTGPMAEEFRNIDAQLKALRRKTRSNSH